MAPLLVRPKPLRPTAPPSPRAPSSLNSGGRHVAASCPPTYDASTGSSSSSSGSSSKTVSRRRSTSTSSKQPRRTSSPSSIASAPPSPSSLVLSSLSGGNGDGIHDYAALEELLSILSAPEGMRASPPPILLPPSRTASRNGNGLSRNGSSNYSSAHRRRSSSIALIRAGSPEVPGLLYSPPSRALTRNPFHRHAATAAAFLPSHTPGASPTSPVAFPFFGAATMPVTPVSGGALKLIMGEGALEDGEASGVSELAPAFEREAVRGVSAQKGDDGGHGEGFGEVAALKEGGGTSSDASA